MNDIENPPAFPACNEANVNGTMGMTLRDWLAGQAVGSVMYLCARDTLNPGETIEAAFARKAYAIADAMLRARITNIDSLANAAGEGE